MQRRAGVGQVGWADGCGVCELVPTCLGLGRDDCSDKTPRLFHKGEKRVYGHREAIGQREGEQSRDADQGGLKLEA